MRWIVTISICFILAGCAGFPHAPSHPENRNLAAIDRIATDAVNHLARLYPPAKTRFNLVLDEPANFGALLATRLREKGYAVAERDGAKPRFSLDAFGAVFQPGKEPAAEQMGQRGQGRASLDTPDGIELRYLLDDMDALFRITLDVGGSQLARAYLADSNGAAAAGAWTFRGP